MAPPEHTATNPSGIDTAPAPGDHLEIHGRKPSDADWFAARPDASSRVRRATWAELSEVDDVRVLHVLVLRDPGGRMTRYPIELRAAQGRGVAA